jgi:hypothetical protein
MYQAARVERQNPYKGHDRSDIANTDAIASFAVLDGAEDAVGSDRAAKVFKKLSLSNGPAELEDIFQSMHNSVKYQRHMAQGKAILRHIKHHEEVGLTRLKAFREAQGWLIGVTTCAAARLDEAADDSCMQYAVVGDSSIRVFGHLSRKTEVITNNCGSQSNGITNAGDFIGAKHYKRPGKSGNLVLPDVATIGLFTDGTDHWNPKCGYDIDEVLASNEPPEIKAQAIADGTTGLDDVAIIIIEYQL